MGFFAMPFLGKKLTRWLVRPYTRYELPGWGFAYRHLVGGYGYDHGWRPAQQVWIRGKLHGYEIPLDLENWSNRMTYFLGRYHDLPAQLLMQRILKEGDTFIDIGANEGAMSLLGSRIVGSAGRVIAFEPNPKPRSILTSAINRNGISNITVMPFGLSHANETLELTAPKSNTGEGSFGRYVFSESDRVTTLCEVRRGDEILKSETPALIKIDVEGFELKVMKGIDETIRKSRAPIIMEVVAGHLANADTSVQEILEFMTARGYQPFKLGLTRRGFSQNLELKPIILSEETSGDFLWQHSSTLTAGSRRK